MKKLLVMVIAALVTSPFATARPVEANGPGVKVASGELVGVRSGDLMVFKGIPFAAPPVGDLRWRPPQPVKPWSGVRSATAFGNECMQAQSETMANPLRAPLSEDCLYLNVWAPLHRASSPLPVMVWIHGGGFVNGGSSPPAFDGSHFAEQGIVFVSINYRLGRFGFFAFPALVKEGGPVGNYAFMDQIAALQWVQRNIANFGGDSHRVTVFGESAGGMSINALLASPLARGLFAQAIIESGAGRDGLLGPVPLDHPGLHGEPSAEQAGIAFAQSMGIEGTGPAALAALRSLPPEKIANGLNMASETAQKGTFPGEILDGTVLTKGPEVAFRDCEQAKVPVMVGANSADLGFAGGRTMDELFALFGANAAAARRAFDVKPDSKVSEVSREIGGARTMVEPARFIATQVSGCGQPAYEFRFSYVVTPLRPKYSGAPHSSEIPYVFDTLADSSWGNLGKGLSSQDLATAQQMNKYWVNFAKTGNPNGAGLPHWPRFTPSGNQLINFTENGTVAETDPWTERLNLVEKIQK